MNKQEIIETIKANKKSIIKKGLIVLGAVIGVAVVGVLVAVCSNKTTDVENVTDSASEGTSESTSDTATTVE